MTSIYDFVEEYAKLRSRNFSMVSWVCGALILLVAGYTTDSGRKLALKCPSSPTDPHKVASPPKNVKTSKWDILFPQCRDIGRFFSLLRIVIPSWNSTETSIIAILSILMVLRTLVSVNLVKMSGKLGRTVIACDKRDLYRDVLSFFVSCIPAALFNTSLSYYKEVLELRFRQNLTRYFHHRYIKRKVFFHLAGLHEISHVDQYLTKDIQRWSTLSSQVFTSIMTPLCEAITFSFFLGKQTGYAGPVLTWGYYSGFLYLLLNYAPNYDYLVEQRMEKEARFRSSNQEVLAYAEEICLGRGVQQQKALLSFLATDIVNHDACESYLWARFSILERLYTLYGSRVLGFVVCSLSLFRAQPVNFIGTRNLVADLTAVYSETSYTYHILAKAVHSLVSSMKLLLVTQGHTQRLAYFMDRLATIEENVNRVQDLTHHSPVTRDLTMPGDYDSTKSDCLNTHGYITRGDHVEFIDVPLTLPNGEILCSLISFFVKPGMNLLVMGPNGCGKSSTFRLLGELWPLQGGRIIKPAQEHLSYMPQRPYIYDGTLFEQLIYPMKMKNVNVSESDLYKYLQLARLDYILDKPNISWKTRLSGSSDVLSMGEKQRLAMARLLFHRPRFAILDECSSLVDLDIEKQFYYACRNMSISVITIAHRRTVWPYHKWILYFDGCGGYLFSPLRFEDEGSTLLLTNVISGSDSSKVGKEVRIKVSSYWEDDLTSARIAMNDKYGETF